jgi:ADP-ribosylglycohydrolase
VKNQIEATLLGLAIGDAMGVPVEFVSREILEKDPVIGYRGFGTHTPDL